MRRRAIAVACGLVASLGAACGAPTRDAEHGAATAASLPLGKEPGVGALATTTTRPIAPTPTSAPTATATSTTTSTTTVAPVLCRSALVQNDGFDDGSVLLSDAMRVRLLELADDAVGLHYARIELVGFADPRPVDDGSNEALSAARADEARRVLIGAGIPAERITARGAGVDPASDLHDPSTWARARRVDVRILC